jgi:phospholipid/cholesterol/gamma-HCH transport system ATP-binding protein
VLQLAAALPAFSAGALPYVRLDLELRPGDCALVEAPNPDRAAALADLCSGMTGLVEGDARFMGLNWAELGRDRAAALRGRIGRIHGKGAWIGLMGTHVNIMLSRLHHTREPQAVIARNATELSRQVGLPGLPLARPDRLSDGDLARAACVRAFLGEPRLLLLENAISPDDPGLTMPLLQLLSQALDRGAAALCFTRDVPYWRAQRFPVSHRLALLNEGLVPMGNA